MSSEHKEAKQLKFRRYLVVNMRDGEGLTPYLCVIVDDDDAFRAAKKDPHIQMVISNVGEPVRKDAYVPLTLIHSHALPYNEEQLEEQSLQPLVNYDESLLQAEEKLIEALIETHKLADEKFVPSPEPESDNSADEEVEELARPDLAAYFSEECVTDSYTLDVPSALMNLSHLIFQTVSNYDAPAFVIASNRTFKPSKAGKGYNFDDFDFFVEYEDTESDFYSDSIAELSKVAEGEYIIPATDHEIAIAAGIVLDKIIRLSYGDITASYEIQDIAKDLAPFLKTKGNTPGKPDSDDVVLYTMLSLLLDLYEGTSTENLFNTLYDHSLLEGYEDSIEDLEDKSDIIENIISVEKLFESQGLNNLFDGIGGELTAPRIPNGAKEADLAMFYGTTLSKSSMPESMRALAEVNDFSKIYDMDIMDNDIMGDLEITEENAKDFLIGLMLALGVRYSRMKAMAEYGLNIITMNIFLKVFQDSYSLNLIHQCYEFAVMNVSSNSAFFLFELASSNMPKDKEALIASANTPAPGTDVPMIMTFPSVRMLHSLNHVIMHEGLNLEALSERMISNNPMRNYILNLENNLILAAEHGSDEICAESLLSLEYVVSSELTNEELAGALSDILTSSAQLSLETYTDFEKDSEEGFEYILGFYRNFLMH